MSGNRNIQVAGERRNINLPMVMIGIGLLLIGAVGAIWVFNSLKTDKPVSANDTDDYSVIPATVNFQAPELVLNDLNGDTVALNDYLGSIILVNNWATWCPPCTAEMPTLQTYFQEHASDGFVLLAVEAGDPFPNVVQFVEDHGLTFTVLLDPMNLSLRVFQNDALPSSYVIDREGTVRLAWTGPINLDNLETYVTPLLEE